MCIAGSGARMGWRCGGGLCSLGGPSWKAIHHPFLQKFVQLPLAKIKYPRKRCRKFGVDFRMHANILAQEGVTSMVATANRGGARISDEAFENIAVWYFGGEIGKTNEFYCRFMRVNRELFHRSVDTLLSTRLSHLKHDLFSQVLLNHELLQYSRQGGGGFKVFLRKLWKRVRVELTFLGSRATSGASAKPWKKVLGRRPDDLWHCPEGIFFQILPTKIGFEFCVAKRLLSEGMVCGLRSWSLKSQNQAKEVRLREGRQDCTWYDCYYVAEFVQAPMKLAKSAWHLSCCQLRLFPSKVWLGALRPWRATSIEGFDSLIIFAMYFTEVLRFSAQKGRILSTDNWSFQLFL